MYPATHIFLCWPIIISQPTSVHQSVSVGHYLLHPNNREFNQGTRPTLANHRLGALLLTPDLSTHTMFRPYISPETSASFFFFSPSHLRFNHETARKTKTLFLGVNPSHELTPKYSLRQLWRNSSQERRCQAAQRGQI